MSRRHNKHGNRVMVAYDCPHCGQAMRTSVNSAATCSSCGFHVSVPVESALRQFYSYLGEEAEKAKAATSDKTIGKSMVEQQSYETSRQGSEVETVQSAGIVVAYDCPQCGQAMRTAVNSAAACSSCGFHVSVPDESALNQFYRHLGEEAERTKAAKSGKRIGKSTVEQQSYETPKHGSEVETVQSARQYVVARAVVAIFDCPQCGYEMRSEAGAEDKCGKCGCLVPVPSGEGIEQFLLTMKNAGNKRKSLGIAVKRSFWGNVYVAFDCPKCSERLRSGIDDAGKLDVCPSCGKEFTVPGESEVKEFRCNAERLKQQREADRAASREVWRQQRSGFFRKLLFNCMMIALVLGFCAGIFYLSLIPVDILNAIWNVALSIIVIVVLVIGVVCVGAAKSENKVKVLLGFGCVIVLMFSVLDGGNGGNQRAKPFSEYSKSEQDILIDVMWKDLEAKREAEREKAVRQLKKLDLILHDK